MNKIHAKCLRRNGRHTRNKLSPQDANTLYTVTACAGWGAHVMAGRGELEESPLTFAFWLSGLDPNGTEELLDVFFSPTDRERLLPELKKAMNKPDDLASLVRITHREAPAGRTRRMAAEMAELLEKWGRERATYADCGLAKHLRDTRQLFGLTDQDLELCFFLSVMKWWGPAQDYFEHHLSCDDIRGRRHLLLAVGLDQAEFGRILAGKVGAIGILDLGAHYLDVEDEFKPYFLDPDLAPNRQDLFREVPGPELASDLLGLNPEKLAFLRSLLSSPGEKPVHVLFYGPPGTGKTTLARALCSELGLKGVEVLGQKENRASSRRAALAACMEMVTGRPDGVIVVDEADQILSTDLPWFRSGEAMDKGYLNGALEQPGVKGIWIVNRHEEIDQAVRRRFAYSLEMPPLGVDKRTVMLEAALRRHGIKRHFTRVQIRELAEDFELTPALFALAAQVGSRVQSSPKACREAVREVLAAQTLLQGKGKVAGRRKSRRSLPFLSCGVNPDRTLTDIQGHVERYAGIWTGEHPRMAPGPLALLFHGLPGTGKTATAAFLAEKIGRSVISKRASDLLDPYVGMTEKNLAAAFSEAKDKGAVLVLDEVDTFLGARSGRRRSWEISMVNELLVQIEQHQGLVICTTNRLESLDEAGLRRFALKVAFRPLTPGQIEEVYDRILGPLARGKLSDGETRRLRALDPVTTADLVLVRRNHGFLRNGKANHRQLLLDLEHEVMIKPQARAAVRTVGF